MPQLSVLTPPNKVEHPITELVTGEDLVEHMLNIAANRPLPPRLFQLPHHCLPFKGWSVECRVYAEDPIRNFLPSTGPLLNYVPPATVIGSGWRQDEWTEEAAQPSRSPVGRSRRAKAFPFHSTLRPTVRVDTGVFEGGQVNMYYDPLLAKLVTHDASREEAIVLMNSALDSYVIRGVENNLSFLRSVFRNKSFLAGDYSTEFIAKEYPNGFRGIDLDSMESCKLIAFAIAVYQAKFGMKDYAEPALDRGTSELIEELIAILPSPEREIPKVFRVYTSFDDAMNIEIKDISQPSEEQTTVRIHNLDWIPGQALAKLNLSVSCAGDGAQGSGLVFEDDDEDEDEDGGMNVEEVMQFEGRTLEGILIRFNGSIQEVIVRTTREHQLSAYMIPPIKKDVSRFLLSPMPGTLLTLLVKEGESVHPGQQLAIVEAMKMQNVLRAEKTGTVSKIQASVGTHLKVDQVILEFK